MKDSLTSGISKTARISVDAPRTIDFMGDDCRVYATPELVRDIEMTCRDLILEHADAGEDSVGTRIAIDHLAPTLLGMWVEITVTVSEVKGRAVSFEIAGRDAVEDIVRGSHNRFVVDVDKTAERLKAKASKAD
jgi:fluoroacetyl-CoA thioesterase